MVQYGLGIKLATSSNPFGALVNLCASSVDDTEVDDAIIQSAVKAAI